MDTASTEVLIVGSGAAGLSCALALRRLGVEVTVLSKSSKETCSTAFAQGGIAAALAENDSPSLHLEDTLKAGAGLVNRDNAWILVQEGIKRVVELIKLGMPFETASNGLPKFTREAAHSVSRVLFCADSTGRFLHETLLSAYDGKIVEDSSVLSIVSEGGVCRGAVVQTGQKLLFIESPVVVIASGGACAIYEKTTNPPTSTGEMLSAALFSGARLKDLEFVQFHPTAVCFEKECFLLSEAIRGEGAVLIDATGSRFMERYHKDAELAPRDVVARAVLRHSRLTGGVFLDMRPLKRKGIALKDRFPYIYRRLKEFGFDPEKEPIPISPAAHYFIGGIDVDSFGRSTLKGLYAVGESACTEVHGANRLASNSLLECLVFGSRAAYSIYMDVRKLSKLSVSAKPEQNLLLGEHKSLSELQKIMWRYVSLERNSEGLTEALNRLSELFKKSETQLDKLSVALALGVTVSALKRQESRGVHYRSDFPFQRDEFAKHSYLFKSDLQAFLS